MKPLATIVSHYNVAWRLRRSHYRLGDALRIRQFYLEEVAKRLDPTLACTCPATAKYFCDANVEVGRARAGLVSSIRLAEAKLGRPHRPF